MSQKYAIEQIKKALDSAGVHAGQARKKIIAQAMEDPQLLQELVRPHMMGIVAHAISRVQRGAQAPEAVATSKPAKMQESEGKDSFGLDILKSIAGGDSVQFGQEAYGRPIAKRGVSQKHIDAIQAMVKKTQGEE